MEATMQQTPKHLLEHDLNSQQVSKRVKVDPAAHFLECVKRSSEFYFRQLQILQRMIDQRADKETLRKQQDKVQRARERIQNVLVSVPKDAASQLDAIIETWQQHKDSEAKLVEEQMARVEAVFQVYEHLQEQYDLCQESKLLKEQWRCMIGHAVSDEIALKKPLREFYTAVIFDTVILLRLLHVTGKMEDKAKLLQEQLQEYRQDRSETFHFNPMPGSMATMAARSMGEIDKLREESNKYDAFIVC